MPNPPIPLPALFDMSPPSDFHPTHSSHQSTPCLPPHTPPPPSVLRNALSSTLGASLVATVVTPFDVVKVRLQAVYPIPSALSSDPHHVSSSFDAARKIIQSDGLRGLWRGLNVSLLLAIPTTGLYFTLYEEFRHRLSNSFPDLSTPTSAIAAGASARTLAATLASPLELARTRLQTGYGGVDATVWSVLKHVKQKQGVRAWWRGLGPTLLRDAPFSAIYWSAYETLKDPQRSVLPSRLFQGGSGFAVYLGAGIGAGGLAALCTVPPDVIKTRRQSVIGGGDMGGPMIIARRILADEGVRGLFRGAGPRVAKVAPACAIMMGSYEVFREVLGTE